MAANSFEKIGNVTLDYTYYGGEDLYSEGVSEDRLLDYVKNHTASDYEHYIQESRSWSVMYHLSHIRENVVSFLPIRSTDKVLEVGSGCGAITGVLARLSKSVTCVELSKKRSMINANRNREYDNVKIMVGNFEDVEKGLSEKYDYITLIGVLEYAASYINSERPYHQFLEILKKHLAPGGKIVIAIENRLGLKYFAGCKEDHLGRYFAGIEGYSREDGVKTFSKAKLTELLNEAGLSNQMYYYPYPDYKLPHTIYSDEKLPGKGDLCTNLRNFDADRLVLFDESKAFDSFIEESMFSTLSNSFLVLASADTQMFEPDCQIPIYAKYGNERSDDYSVCTVIAKDGSDKKTVYKVALSAHANTHVKNMSENYSVLLEQYEKNGLVPAKCEFVPGKEKGILLAGVARKAKDMVICEYVNGITLEDYLNELEEQKRYEEMETLILEYRSKLMHTSDEVDFKRSVRFDEIFGKREFKKRYVATSPCNFDMIFSNIMLDKEELEKGTWSVLDYEWVLDFAVPVSFVLYRALFYHFQDKSDDGFALYLSRKGMDVYSLCGIDIGERMLFAEMEHSFQVHIIGGAASLEVMQVLMPQATMRLSEVTKMGSYLRNLDTPKIYYSRSGAFSSENQIPMIAKVSDGRVSMRIPFENYFNFLRIDPTEYPCMIKVHELKYTMGDGTKVDVDSLVINGYRISNDSYLFDTNDSQMIMENVPQNAKALEVSYNVSMIDNQFYEDILKVLKEREEKERDEKLTVSYRAKRKIGVIKEEVLPEGFKKIRLTKE